MTLLTVILLVAPTLAACGDADDPAGAATAPASGAAKLPAPDNADGVSGAGAEIAEALSDLQADFGALREPHLNGYPFSVCQELTKAGQEQLARLRLGGKATCDGAVNWIAMVNIDEGVRPWVFEIDSIVLDGSRASVFVTDREGRSRVVPFADEGARGWRVASFLYAEPVAPGVWNAAAAEEALQAAGPDVHAEIREAVDDAQLDFARADAGGVCAELTAPAEAKLAVRLGRRDDDIDCEGDVTAFAKRNAQVGQPPRFSRVHGFDVSGNRATAILSAPEVPPRRVAFRKEFGVSWKLLDLGAVLPLAVVPR